MGSPGRRPFLPEPLSPLSYSNDANGPKGLNATATKNCRADRLMDAQFLSRDATDSGIRFREIFFVFKWFEIKWFTEVQKRRPFSLPGRCEP